MPAKKKPSTKPLTGAALVKEVCRRIRVARSYWDAHNNRACRGEREKAMALYETLSEAEREDVMGAPERMIISPALATGLPSSNRPAT